MEEVIIIDYGMGNLGSIKNILKKIGYSSMISSEVELIQNAKRLILPGVGKFDKAMSNLEKLGLIETIKQKAKTGTPVLGICLGMQLLAEKSEEGVLAGLGLIEGEVLKFANFNQLKVPHMGWNLLECNFNCPLFNGFDSLKETKFYFVHSYHFQVQDPNHSVSKTSYGITFTSSVWKNNIFGVQYHPEKSHKFGMRLFENFMKIPC